MLRRVPDGRFHVIPSPSLEMLVPVSYTHLPFDPIGESYNKIIRDFKEAEKLLAEHGEYFDRTDENAGGFVKDRVIHMNLYAVQALLARVYWEKGDLETAKNYACLLYTSREPE